MLAKTMKQRDAKHTKDLRKSIAKHRLLQERIPRSQAEVGSQHYLVVLEVILAAKSPHMVLWELLNFKHKSQT